MSGSLTDLGKRSERSPDDDLPYDPDRHDNQLVAVFEHRRAADQAREALLGAGIPEGAIEVLDADPDGDHAAGSGIWAAIRNLFAPEQDYDDYGHALGRGHAMLVVTPIGGTDRQLAIEALEASEPLDFDAKRAEWRPTSPAVAADLMGKEPPGRDEVMLGTTGQPVRVKSMSTEDMAAAGALSEHDPTLRRQSEATDDGREDVAAPPLQTTYTHGVPPEVASELSPEQQVAMQPPAASRAEAVRVVEERLRVGRREQPPGAVRVRSYVAERDPASLRVRLEEE